MDRLLGPTNDLFHIEQADLVIMRFCNGCPSAHGLRAGFLCRPCAYVGFLFRCYSDPLCERARASRQELEHVLIVPGGPLASGAHTGRAGTCLRQPPMRIATITWVEGYGSSYPLTRSALSARSANRR